MTIGKVYVASSLDNKKRVSDIIENLKLNGIDITYDWTSHGRVYDLDELKEIAVKEENGVRECDLFIMVLPGGGGTHFEFGIARTLNKKIFILEELDVEQKSFYYLEGLNKYPNYEMAKDDIISELSKANKHNVINQ